LETQLRQAIAEAFPSQRLTLAPGSGQGNHLTWNVEIDGTPMFARVEHGPEQDQQLAIESAVMGLVAATGVPVPRVAAVDATRQRVPFGWQVMERIPFPDLNHWFKEGSLKEASVAQEIGKAVATWQAIPPAGFGPFATAETCYHSRYDNYFHLRLDDHLRFLQDREFIDADKRRKIEAAIYAHRALLALDSACLVHKDLALWNILGSAAHIAAFIDFDDAIGGDPMDDLSLLACFHDQAFLRNAFHGYATIRPLPEEHRRRFWLHLLRNMLVKAVIRVGAGYFERSDGFFLIRSGGSGADLRKMTHERIQLALDGLATDADLTIL
jgi:aminoglycoside phosphotransferase (APT) family kinase protein